MSRLCFFAILAWAAVAGAQPAKPLPQQVSDCVDVDTTPGAPLEPPPAPDVVVTPIPWTEFAVESAGKLLESDTPVTVHALLEPTLASYRTTLTDRNFTTIAKTTARFGYQLVSHTMRGTLLVLRVVPLPIVRKVNVNTHQQLWQEPLDDEIRSRMQVRVGAPLPSDRVRRRCALLEEQDRVQSYLTEQGYSDALVTIHDNEDPIAAVIGVDVKLRIAYRLEKPKIELPAGFTNVTKAEIESQFERSRDTFTRSRFLEDVQRVRDLFHKREYPAARVQSDFDPKESFHRDTKTVRVTITIDPRRQLDLVFEGIDHDAVSDQDLRSHVTFDQTGAIDDVEAQNSADALQTYLQTRGYFDARVTWGPRERLPELDRIPFHIVPGRTRQVSVVDFKCNGGTCQKDRPFDSSALASLVSTKKIDFKSDLLGTGTAPTSSLLAGDIQQLRNEYRKAGYREAEVSVSVSPADDDRALAPDSAAIRAALVEAGAGDSLAVTFEIDQGRPTLLTAVELVPDDPADAPQLAQLCEPLLKELASDLSTPQPDDQPDPARMLAQRTDRTRCTAAATNLPFREDDVSSMKDHLRDFLFKQGRPRAEVDYEAHVVGPYLVQARYVVHHARTRTLGKLVVRGNFKTETSVIRDVLALHEGQLLTSDALADAARRLRQTGLFSAVNLDLVDLNGPDEQVDVVVRIEERYDVIGQIDVGGGYSSYNGWFATGSLLFANPLGNGMSVRVTGTYGDKLKDIEGTLRVPKWLAHLWGAQIDVTGQLNDQDTPNFGPLETTAITLATNRIDVRQQNGSTPARTRSCGLHYDYRKRTRQLDALRPIGADNDSTQVPVTTVIGSIGGTCEIDGRVDRHGQLSPLAPENGYHLYSNVAYAMSNSVPLIGGQDTFIKFAAAGSYFHLFGENLILRGDFHFDEGLPLGGAALLPDVEQFFAGGDNTVRGYEDDRLATEVIRMPVPPIGGGLTQIRVLPAGGNIRVMSSIDAQYRIWWIFAASAFTDAGMIANDWRLVTSDDIRPSVGMGLRALSPFGIAAFEYAVPINPHLGDDPRGRYHLYFAARATF
ncbi:MAG TPA: POTRA domain-containing protein [Kofleriaceae bacterium]|nr:POTRA domain-containing protein [Kofleriaceae bacterium]